MQNLFGDFNFISVQILRTYYDNHTEYALRYHLNKHLNIFKVIKHSEK